MIPVCHRCKLPARIHFAACAESGIKGYQMPEASMRDSAIVYEARELRYCKPVDPAKLKSRRKG